METWTTLKQSAKDLALDDQTTSYTNLSASDTFLAKGLNDTIKVVFSMIREYNTQGTTKTVTTADGTVYYDNPAGISSIESVTMAIGSIDYPLTIVHSQAEWDRLNQIDTTGGIPSRVFPRRDDFGIWPTPGGAYTVTVEGHYNPKPLNAEDYDTGTITTTLNDATITGAGTTFTSDMVGRFFRVDYGESYSNWYRIATFTDTTNMELDRTFTDTAASGDSYVIGQAPELPESIHEFLPYRAAAIYYRVRRKDPEQSKALMNYFYTGDFENDKREGKIHGGVLGELRRLKKLGSGNSQITYTSGQSPDYNYIRDGIWGLTLS